MFLYLKDSAADDQHYLQRKWLVREVLTPGICNVKTDSLINSGNILLSIYTYKIGANKKFCQSFGKREFVISIFPNQVSTSE